MKFEHYPEKRLKKQLCEIINRCLPELDHSLYFFGSRVKGTNQEGSDIDLVIEPDRRLTAEEKFVIEDGLEAIPTLYSFDLVDLHDTHEPFREQALNNSEEIKVA